MVFPLGLILTSARSLDSVRRHVAAGRLECLKVVTGWGLDTPWTPTTRREAARIAPQLIVRTMHGDPSLGPTYAFPYANQVAAEIAPWWDARDPARPFWAEVGNEPLLQAEPDDDRAWFYRHHLGESVAELRRRFPGIRIIGPAHTLNAPIRVGSVADGQSRWTVLLAPVLRQCDALGLHAYSIEQYVRGMGMLRAHVRSNPVWLTEFALDEPLGDAARGARYAAQLHEFAAAGACLYHLDELGGADPVHFNPRYALTTTTLESIAAARHAPPVTPNDTAHYPDVRVDGFTMDVRHWRTVESFRAHLVRHDYRRVAPWAKGVVVHHTYRPLPAAWRGPESIRALARFYRGEGWTTGPHLFIVRGAPAPAHDGIWQLTPLNAPGTHARAANGSTWGLEHVGDFTRAPMPPGLAALGYGTAAALLDWADLATSPATVTPHAQWGKPGCPGAGVDMDAYRRGVAALQRRGR